MLYAYSNHVNMQTDTSTPNLLHVVSVTLTAAQTCKLFLGMSEKEGDAIAEQVCVTPVLQV